MAFNILVFVLGLGVGSFLNVVIYRLHSEESIVSKRSHCTSCGHVLSWYELVPIVSFIIQRGRCRSCGESISLQYPLVEIGTAMLFTLVIFNFKFFSLREIWHSQTIFEFLNPAYYLAITSLLIIIFVYDLKHYIIPDKIIYPAIFLVLVNRVVEFLILNHLDLFKNLKLEIKNFEPLMDPLFIAIAVSASFAAIFFVSRGKWLGFGDVKFAFFMGLFLGWPSVLVALFMAFFLGGIIGVALILLRRKTMKSQVPFGPFLVLGTFIALFWGREIAGWYIGLLT